jgi:hypothetical protein
MSDSDKISFDQVGCARCDEVGHEGMVFTKLTHPFEPTEGDVWTHWAPCPTNGEPILLQITMTE